MRSQYAAIHAAAVASVSARNSSPPYARCVCRSTATTYSAAAAASIRFLDTPARPRRQ